MRFMMIVKANKDHEAGRPPSPELMAAVGKLAEEGMQSGLIVSNGGLLPSSKGARIRVGGGKLTVVDGPFPETKELVGGFAIIEAGSKQEAIEAGSRFMQVHVDVVGVAYEGELEIRQMYQPAECGDWKE